MNATAYVVFLRRMLKAPPLKSSDLNLSVQKCHCRTYDDNIGPKLNKPSFAILGVYNITFIGSMLKHHCRIFLSGFQPFSNIFGTY